LNDEEVKNGFTIKTLCEHNDLGSLYTWVVVATTLYTFGLVTEKLAMEEPSWQYTMLHYFMIIATAMSNWYGVHSKVFFTRMEWRKRGMVVVLQMYKKQLAEERNCLDAMLIAKGITIVDIFLKELEVLTSEGISKHSILYCIGFQQDYLQLDYSYKELFPNFPLVLLQEI
jgi:hypothetical protein